VALKSYSMKGTPFVPQVAPAEGLLREYYRVLYAAFGRQHWWPARTRFEVIVGAYLTQNTAWTNVENAMRKLRSAGVLNLDGIRNLSLERLETLVRPAGYFRQKAQRLKTFVAFVDENYGGSLRRMFAQPTAKLREELLSLNGVGPETADSILLYAGQHPVFVVDAYTRRVLHRHGILPAIADYEDIRELFERALNNKDLNATCPEKIEAIPVQPHPPSAMSRAKRSSVAQIYNDMHGLIVQTGKHFCFKRNPACPTCPLRDFLPKTMPFVQNPL